jgi:diacylglycerol O-acyltransferase
VLDRLSPGDLANVRAESWGAPMHVAGLVLLDGAPMRGSGEGFPVAALRAEIDRRLDRAPRLRQRLHRPAFGGGRPIWVDDPRFDVSAHVHERSVPAPGDERALLDVCAEIGEAPLFLSQPPWDLWFLHGLADGSVAMLIRMHHVVADGVASVALLGSLFDGVPDPPAVPWVPAPAPSDRELRRDNVRSHVRAVERAITYLAHPRVAAERMGATAVAMKDVVGEGTAPRTSLNVPVRDRRRHSLARADLERCRAVAHEQGGTINDVLLASVAGGAASLLLARGEPVDVLRTSVPASIRSAGDPVAGNLVSLMIVPLPVGESDPTRRVATIARETARRKRRPRMKGALPGSALTQRTLVAAMRRQRIVNLFTSNVVGPTDRLAFAGAEVRDLFQLGVVQGNVPVSVGAISYAGRLNVDVVVDADVVPDAERFVAGLVESLDELGVSAPG